MQILSEKNKILSYYYVSRVDRGSLDTLSPTRQSLYNGVVAIRFCRLFSIYLV